MRTSRAVFLILCLLAAASVAACGDDSGSGGSGGSADDFIAQADQVCTDAAEEAVANTAPLPTTAEAAVPYLKDSLKRREQQLADFEALGEPPSEIADEWNEAIGKFEQRVANSEELVKLARQGVKPTDPKYANVVSESSDLDEEENEILKGIGSTACAEVLPADERKEVIDFVTVFETKALDDCTEYMTDEAIKLLFGSLAECQRVQLNPPPEGFTKKVKVTHIEGISGVTVAVDASLEGGIGDGQKVTYTLVYVDGGYKIDAVTTQA